MNDDALDELIALYRQSANETAPRRMDARVLRALESQASARRVRQAWPWLGLALAASCALWLLAHHATPARHAPALADDPTGTYLLHMDVTPPNARRDAYASRSDGILPAQADSGILQEKP